MQFTDQQKAEFIVKFIEERRSYVNFVRRIRREQGRNAIIPIENTLKNWLDNFMKTASVQSQRGKVKSRLVDKKFFISTSFRRVRTPETIDRVKNHFETHPHDSVRKNGLGLAKSTLHEILRKDLKWHPYKIQLLQELYPSDHIAR